MKKHPTILDLAPNGCKWPIAQDHKGEHRFCNEPRTISGPYCAQHRAKAYTGHSIFKPFKDRRGTR